MVYLAALAHGMGRKALERCWHVHPEAFIAHIGSTGHSNQSAAKQQQTGITVVLWEDCCHNFVVRAGVRESHFWEVTREDSADL